MVKLSNCPFCGSDRIAVHNIRDGQQAVCKDCGAMGKPAFYGPEGPEGTRDKAAEAWNIRSAVPVAALEAKVEASEKARDEAITHRLKANHDWRVAYEALELKLSSAEAMKNIAYAAGYYQAECGLPEHDDAKEALKDWRENKILEAALAGDAGVPAFKKSSSFALEWLSGARPPVHPEPMVGRQTFETFKEAIGFMARRAMDSQLTGLIEHTALRAGTNRTAEAQEELQKLRSQYDDFSTDPRRWSWSKLIREKPNGLRAVVAEYERRLAE